MNIEIKNLPCYPEVLLVKVVDGEVANDLGLTDFPCENCEHWVEDYPVCEGINVIGYSMKCDKDVWSEGV